ncbi:MAG TPA: alpha-1,4-glucan--maltose-1-phosphate maltosyltransferase [Terriglobales bacterium]|nr:alpha-1,4-glucan--maltose-1-phosphate maltosyltransferase [Terriglobales bacterium]
MTDLEKGSVLPPFARRVIIENVQPEVDCGRFPIKRTVGEPVEVTGDIFADGHDVLLAVLRHRPASQSEWQEVAMEELANDRWQGKFPVTEEGRHFYTLQAWTDRFQSWVRDLARKFEAAQDISVDILVGVQLIEAAALRAGRKDRGFLATRAEEIKKLATRDLPGAVKLASGPELKTAMVRNADRRQATTYGRELAVVVDREKARFSAWYEMFPRSTSSESTSSGPGHPGTLRDCADRLDYVAAMGFDVLYLPPIHPIGRVHRKGKNNAEKSSPEDPGSPWAIGSRQGGHKAIDPQLGTLEDFKHLLSRANQLGLEIALDLAYQCAPDHPYVKEHPQWFRSRPDGTVQYAENPPKKYQDIYPFDFETDQTPELWEELRSIVLYWIEQGVKIFRVDNPHTKPFEFWEWLIGDIKNGHPEILFLAEAFTRPKVMYELAKLGFTQSYTYFAWRNSKWELMEYFKELTQSEVREYFRANLWPNTPDILTDFLQQGGRPAFMIRLLLAATLGANYGIYGPAFELGEGRAVRQGSEEYLDSEKYQIRNWDLEDPNSLAELMARVNQIRRQQVALRSDWRLRFHPVDNDQIIAYSKMTDDFLNIIVVVVNLDPHRTQSGMVDLPLDEFHLDTLVPYQMHDLLSDARYVWRGPRNYVELNPQRLPAHIFCVRRRVRSEGNVDYFV